MSSAIRDVEKLNQRQIETAKRRNERELKTMEANHQSHRAELQKTQASELVDLEHAHHGQINQQAIRKEKVLEEMKNHLEQTKDLTEKELKSLKEAAEKDLVNHQRRLLQNRERLNSDNGLYLEELNYRFNESAKKVSADGKKRVDDVKTKMQDEYQNTESYFQDKINKKTNDFTTRFKHDDMNYKMMKDHQDNQFKKERMATNVRQQTELQKMTNSHTGHIEKRDQNFRKGLKDQDLFFEKKYADQLSKHQNEFKTLEEKNKNVLEGLKSSLTKEVTKAATRSDDPFYKFETLKPRLKQFEDRVEVEVEIPDHSKQDVQLTIHGKEAIVAFNRRYNDAVKMEDGSINKINKVESFTTRLPTSHILDAKSVKSSYENGVMTYVIKKA